MKRFISHFKFNRQERSGIFFLLFCIVLLQVGYFIYISFPEDEKESLTVDSEIQAEIDALKASSARKDSIKIYPFNPNFITDYKGYTLGMSVEEIDRLQAYRATDNYVNTPADFQKVTQVSDALLRAISPYFKFPEWTKKKQQYPENSNQHNLGKNSPASFATDARIRAEGTGLGDDLSLGMGSKDLNLATAEDLQKIKGIGEKLSARIIKFRDRLGGFLVDEQLYDVYGLEPDVVKRTLTQFTVVDPPEIEKINVTWASYNELRNLLYINNKFAKSIIEYRKYNTIKSLAELKTLEGFPEGRFERIKLYLSL